MEDITGVVKFSCDYYIYDGGGSSWNVSGDGHALLIALFSLMSKKGALSHSQPLELKHETKELPCKPWHISNW